VHAVKPNVRLIAALVLIGAVWALTFPLTKIAVLGGYRNFGIIFWSSIIAVIILGGVVALRGLKLPLHRGALGRYAFVAFFGTILSSALSYTAAEHLPAGVISVCMSIIPMVSLPLAIAVGLDRATWGRVLGLALGLLGVLLMTLPETSLPDPAKAIFIPLALLAVLCYAIEGVGLGRIGRAGLDPIQLLLGASVVTSIVTLPIAVVTGTFFIPPWPFGTAEAAVMLSGLANAVAYVGFVWMVGRGGAVYASQVAYVVTGFGVVWSMVLVGEAYSLWVWSALAVIFAGLFLTQPRPARDGARAPAMETSPDLK
jgi:drug/metabolite transporter (DMT)-like permease